MNVANNELNCKEYNFLEEGNLIDQQQYDFSFDKDYSQLSIENLENSFEHTREKKFINDEFMLEERESDFISLISEFPKSVEDREKKLFQAPILEGTGHFKYELKSNIRFTVNENIKKISKDSEEVKKTVCHEEADADIKNSIEREDLIAKKSKNYSILVDSLLIRSHKTCKSLTYRKDVVNKKILRAFKKRICSQFLLKEKRPCRALNSIKVLKDNLLKEATRIGLISSKDKKDKELSELVCWMSMTKITKITKSIFDYQNQSISTLDDILSKYSHVKLRSLSKNKKIAKIFAYFVKN
eukprot:CAMPEP_0205805592 /NCGR_PEP_ID=MMETSP0205-20121125/8867_1 /ASSEMBLY_ACC=CAM_ASM_000278 /TAXON_ID=36767 /ORGANISM="Euplotes focardii, Strain TN1" /LENGTH=298 /DNA_ID=CAMNT_0053077067 /DNA_START=6 /DNA_END=902 /DNA_ORIENTATION=-